MRRFAFVVLCSCMGVTLWSTRADPPSASAQAQFQSSDSRREKAASVDDAIDQHSQQMVANGRKIFRFDTFGDEAFWGDSLRLHDAIKGQRSAASARG